MRRNALSNTSPTTPPPLRNHDGIPAFWNQPGNLLLRCRSTRSLSLPLICRPQDASSHSSYLHAHTCAQTSTKMMEGETLAPRIDGTSFCTSLEPNARCYADGSDTHSAATRAETARVAHAGYESTWAVYHFRPAPRCGGLTARSTSGMLSQVCPYFPLDLHAIAGEDAAETSYIDGVQSAESVQVHANILHRCRWSAVRTS